MFCKYCGKEISDTARFCKYCGQSVSTTKSQLRETEPSEASAVRDNLLAGFWIRAGAYIFDYGLITIIWGVIWAFFEWPEYYDGVTEYLILFLYHTLFLSRISTTPGKKFFGLTVADASSGKNLTFGKAMGRTLSYALSSIFLGLGFLNVAWHKRKQGWHDLLAKTVVIRKPKKLLLPILSTLLLWAVLGGLAWYGDDTYYYSGLPGEAIIKSLDDFLSDKPTNFQELFYNSLGIAENNYEIEVTEDSGKIMLSQEIASKNEETIVFIRTDQGIGSGFLISPDGLIATNYHVIADASQVGIQMNDGSQHLVISIVDYDEAQDFAIMKIDITNSPYSVLGDSDLIQLGEEVVVIGNPEGLSNSVTRGIISSTLREIDGEVYIQIDAPISAGSSGGPIFNSYGQVIGIATLYLTEGQNLNFGVPINKIFNGPLERTITDEKIPVQVEVKASAGEPKELIISSPIQKKAEDVQQEPIISQPAVEANVTLEEITDEEFSKPISQAYYDAELRYGNTLQCQKSYVYDTSQLCQTKSLSGWVEQEAIEEATMRRYVRQGFSHVHGRLPSGTEEGKWLDRVSKFDVSGIEAYITKLRFYEARGSTTPN